jgi:histidine ammonia-lyase
VGERAERAEVVIGPEPLSVAEVEAVARRGARVGLSAAALERLAAGRAVVERLASSDRPVYGVSTGFGALATRFVSVPDRLRLQRSLVASHAAGMGAPIEAECVRAMMLLRLRTLAMGRSGVRPVVAERLAALLNANVTPEVPEHGSLGCSGDLAPLAHVALVLQGHGRVQSERGDLEPAEMALERAGLEPLELAAKEGLALLNGTDGMLGMLSLAVIDAEALLTLSDLAAAMSLEALLGTDQVLRPELHAPLRPHPGQAVSAASMLRLLEGSEIVASHRLGDPRVQDAYSLRCAPQVNGAARDALRFVSGVVDEELASCIDNPVLTDEGEVASNGNFHGAPLAHAADFLAIVSADVAAMAERRTDRMLDPARSAGLPPFLADDPGVDSGMMIAHYTQASMVAEAKRLAVPASVDTIPTSAMQEDHVSMGWAACRKLRRSLELVRSVLAIEVVVAARALELRAPLRPAPATAAVVSVLREVVPGPGPDRPQAPELAWAARLASEGRLVQAAESVSGPL